MYSPFRCKCERVVTWCLHIGVLWILTLEHVISDSDKLDPALFPLELKEVFNNLNTQFDCNFNHKSFCAFKFVPTDWSFHQSMRELAEKLRIAAEAAANALSTATNVSHNASDPNLQEMEFNPVTVPQANYFPCVTKTAILNSSTPNLCILELSVPWPRFTSFVAPTGKPPAGVGLFDLASDKTQVLSNPFISTSPSSTHLSMIPLACLQMDFRFPPNQSSQVNIDFVSPLQKIRTGFNRMPTTSHSRRSVRSSDALLEVDPLPHDVWMELTVPIPAAFGIADSGHESYSLYSDTATLPSIAFGSHNIRWIATLIFTPLRLQITSGVCVDNFRFRSLQPDELHTNSCTRSLRWMEPLTAKNNLLLIDEFGIPIAPSNEMPVLDSTNTPLLRLYEPRGSLNEMDWLRFTGSLVLSVTVTLLFLLFVSVIGLSITMARRRYSRTSRSHRLTVAASRIDRSKDVHDSLLSETTCPISNGLEVHSVDLEPGSTQGGESLFHNGTDTYQSGTDTQIENSMLGSQMGSTASVQLLRNWYFYRRKANRIRHHPRAHEAHTVSRHPSPLVPPPAVPSELVTRPIQRRNTATAADNPCRHSFILSADADNQLVILPAFHSGSAPSTSMRGPRRSSDTHLGMIPESPFYTSEDLSRDIVQWETDHHLDTECAQSLESMPQSPSAPPPPDFHTLSTIPRSRLSSADESSGSVGFTSPSDFAVSDSRVIQR